MNDIYRWLEFINIVIGAIVLWVMIYYGVLFYIAEYERKIVNWFAIANMAWVCMAMLTMAEHLLLEPDPAPTAYFILIGNITTGVATHVMARNLMKNNSAYRASREKKNV